MTCMHPFTQSFTQAGLLVALLTSCAAGEGEVEVRAWGEDFIEVGIPADAMADGWAIEFSRFEVELTDVSVAATEIPDPDPIELTTASADQGHLVGRASGPTGDHDDAAFTITRVVVEGTATQADPQLTKSFAWTFEMPTRYVGCEVMTTVPRDAVGTFQITVHADHLFYDSLVSEEPALRFAALAAADLDDDGTITQTELETADIGAYDPGNMPISDLWSFLLAQVQTLGHANGEAHCDASSV
jgi:hypothetical protein